MYDPITALMAGPVCVGAAEEIEEVVALVVPVTTELGVVLDKLSFAELEGELEDEPAAELERLPRR